MENIEEIIIDLKQDIMERKNKKLNIKFRTLIAKFGYKRRSTSLMIKINEYLEKHNIAVYAKREEGWDWEDILIDERITFEIIDNKGEGMDSLIKSDYAGRIKVRDERNPIELYLHQIEALQSMDR